MNIYLRTRKLFESAVDFVIGCVQSGKVLGPEGCYVVKSLLAFTLSAVYRICALCTLQIQRVTCLCCVLVVALQDVNVLRGTYFKYVSLIIQLYAVNS